MRTSRRVLRQQRPPFFSFRLKRGFVVNRGRSGALSTRSRALGADRVRRSNSKLIASPNAFAEKKNWPDLLADVNVPWKTKRRNVSQPDGKKIQDHLRDPWNIPRLMDDTLLASQ
ncbi:hypothetical protein K0M31_002835 [Melipona bicolor]|uniref:Uncharacterized protein n=1 Tax=Melipona bicolor TaxID=60889 RepID=A0AA40KPV8_9HYME|nr:hypothetical protein K0M31_002835 [Melipona bicolor]